MVEDDEEESRNECKICMANPRAVRMRPCGHASTRIECRVRLIEPARHRLRCLLCKQHALTAEWVQRAMAKGGIPTGRLPAHLVLLPPVHFFCRRCNHRGAPAATALRHQQQQQLVVLLLVVLLLVVLVVLLPLLLLLLWPTRGRSRGQEAAARRRCSA